MQKIPEDPTCQENMDIFKEVYKLYKAGVLPEHVKESFEQLINEVLARRPQ